MFLKVSHFFPSFDFMLIIFKFLSKYLDFLTFFVPADPCRKKGVYLYHYVFHQF